MKVLIINNLNSNKKDLSWIRESYPFVEIINTKNKKQLSLALNYSFKNNFKLIIACGGDGTINFLINKLMNYDKKKRKQIVLSVLPSGSANDLAKILNIPSNPKKAIKKIIFGKKICLDLIKVNKKYFITGGGFGLPVDVVRETEKSLLKKFLRDKIYFFEVTKIILKGCNSVNKIKIPVLPFNELITLSIMNQPYIGRRFFLAPEAKNNDGLFDVCVIKKGRNFLFDFFSLFNIIRKKHINYDFVSVFKTKKLKIIFNNKRYFMGDGEILDFSKKFYFTILKKEICFLH